MMMYTKRALSTTEYAVLGLLRGGGQTSGYDLAARASRSIGHFWVPARSHIYRVLPRLVDGGYARRREVAQSGRPDKQLYRITAGGATALSEWLERLEPEPRSGRGELLLKIFFGRLASPEVVEGHLRAYRSLLEERLGAYRAIEHAIAGSRDPDDFFADLTLQHGLARVRATIRWADASLARLAEHRALTELPTA